METTRMASGSDWIDVGCPYPEAFLSQKGVEALIPATAGLNLENTQRRRSQAQRPQGVWFIYMGGWCGEEGCLQALSGNTALAGGAGSARLCWSRSREGCLKEVLEDS